MGIQCRYPVSTVERRRAAAIIGVALLAAAFLLATGSLLGAPVETAQSASPQWTQGVGAGIAAPACGSADASNTCSGGSPQVTITWSNSQDHGYGCQFATVSISGNQIGGQQPCSGSVTWTGAANGTQYSYHIGYWYDPPLGCYAGMICDSRGSCGCLGPDTDPPPLEFHSSDNPGFPPPGESNDPFTTPNCAPPVTASCSVSPTSATVGQSVTWTASASGGTGSYSYSWSGDAPLAGQTANPVSVSYPSSGTKTGSVTVTSGIQSVTQACSNSVTVSAPETLSVSLTATPPSGTAPLTTSLEALESGSAVGTRNFSFWWSCTNPTPNVSTASAFCGALPSDTTPTSDGCTENAIGAKCDGETESRRAIFHTYEGTFTAKVIVEKGTAPPAQAQQTVLVIAAPLPDLIIESPSVSGTMTVGSLLTFSGTVKNQVSGSTAGVSNTEWQIDFGNNGSVDETAASPTGLLVFSATETETKNWTAVVGTHSYRFCADIFTAVAESNEGNNCTLFQTFTVSAPAPQCSDLGDNDGDGSVDFGPDPGCSSPTDDDERNACTDGIDNDGDGVIDHSSVNPPGGPLGNPDPGCSSAQDNSEANPPVFCEVNPDDPNATCQ